MGRLLASDLGVAVVLAVDLVEVSRRQHGGGLVGAGDGVRGVHVAGGDVGPVPRQNAQRGECAADEAGLPRHLHDGVPIPTCQRPVCPGLAPIGGHQHGAASDRAAGPAGETRRRVPALHRLPGEFAPQPCGAP